MTLSAFFLFLGSLERGRSRDRNRRSTSGGRSRSRTPLSSGAARRDLTETRPTRRRKPASHWDRDSDGNALANGSLGSDAVANLAVMSAITRVRII